MLLLLVVVIVGDTRFHPISGNLQPPGYLLVDIGIRINLVLQKVINGINCSIKVTILTPGQHVQMIFYLLRQLNSRIFFDQIFAADLLWQLIITVV